MVSVTPRKNLPDVDQSGDRLHTLTQELDLHRSNNSNNSSNSSNNSNSSNSSNSSSSSKAHHIMVVPLLARVPWMKRRLRHLLPTTAVQVRVQLLVQVLVQVQVQVLVQVQV